MSSAEEVSHALDWQVPLLKPALAVHGAERLLAGCDEVLVIAFPRDLQRSGHQGAAKSDEAACTAPPTLYSSSSNWLSCAHSAMISCE
jgi:hypothetical protein